MAIVKRKGVFYSYSRPFGKELIGVRTSAKSKTQAKALEAIMLRAFRSGDYSGLDAESKDSVLPVFQNKGWEIPETLRPRESIQQEITFWKGARLFLTYPGIKESRELSRYEMCMAHLVRFFGKETPVRSIWVPEIRHYIAQRLSEDAAPSTVNREKGTLSKMYQVLVEMRLVYANPCRLLRNLSQKSEERQVYISHSDFEAIVDRCPDWIRPIIQTAFYTGMRRGEILALTRRQVNLSKRMIQLRPENTKEGRWKRVPIHLDLIPILEESLKVSAFDNSRVFLIKEKTGVRPPSRYSIKNPWRKAVGIMNIEPCPRFHDLRHTWKTNARRSGVHPEIQESIMGHWFRGRNISERYGRISDEELVKAIDLITFDHGQTEIFVARQ